MVAHSVERLKDLRHLLEARERRVLDDDGARGEGPEDLVEERPKDELLAVHDDVAVVIFFLVPGSLVALVAPLFEAREVLLEFQKYFQGVRPRGHPSGALFDRLAASFYRNNLIARRHIGLVEYRPVERHEVRLDGKPDAHLGHLPKAIDIDDHVLRTLIGRVYQERVVRLYPSVQNLPRHLPDALRGLRLVHGV